MRKNVIRMTKKTIGIIQRTRRTMKCVRLPALLVARRVLVVERGVRDAHVRLDEVVLVLLVEETNCRLVDEHLLRGQVVGVALGLVQLGVSFLDQCVIPAQRRAAPVQVVT